ncbi:DUF4054 domain-containing protein [Mycoavidus sp. HKI]|uniref:DUF4054 domain-containing protein n=1 Tax=Mycoavidus sp. HKI TaxID=2840467 RepID=UPI001CBBFB65|nr:DUF4054 domain-containing protein [Mycoavidus sp. HKI]UAW63481.1 DUF4054 domain-containing protein [Mycoavidus sp. HKI]
MMGGIIQFDVSAFRLSFPAFANMETYPDASLLASWDAATCYVSPQNYGYLQGESRARALNLMTAHLVALADIVKAGQMPSMVSASTVDKVAVTLTPPPVKSQWQWWLSLTPYGQQLLALLSASAAGGFYIGGLPEGSGFRRVHGIYP